MPQGEIDGTARVASTRPRRSTPASNLKTRFVAIVILRHRPSLNWSIVAWFVASAEHTHGTARFAHRCLRLGTTLDVTPSRAIIWYEDIASSRPVKEHFRRTGSSPTLLAIIFYAAFLLHAQVSPDREQRGSDALTIDVSHEATRSDAE